MSLEQHDSSDLRLPLVTDEDRETEARTESRRKRLTLGAVLLCLVVVNTTFSIATPIFPQEAARHGVGAASVGLIFSSFAFVDFLSSIGFGRALQKRIISRRVALVLGIVVLSVSTAGFGLVAALSTRAAFIAGCLVLRLISGIACAAVDTSATATTASLFKDSEYFGTVMGISESMMSVGWIVGPVVGASASTAFGFGAPFYAVGALALAFTPVAWLSLPEDEAAPIGDSRPPASVRTLVAHPPISILIITASVAAAMLTWADPVLAPHLESIGFSTNAVGLWFGLNGAIYAVCSPLAGLLGDKVGRFPVICSGLALCGAACLLLGPMPWLPLPPDGYALVWVAMLVLGFGSTLAFSPITPAILRAAEAKVGAEPGLEDIVSGMIGGTFSLGCGSGPMLGGAAADVFGFAWTASLFGFVILAQAVVVATLFFLSSAALEPAAAGSKARRLTRTDLSESHDRVRASRGGLAAMSADLTLYSSDGEL